MADSDMLRAAEAEVLRLEAELAQTQAYKKLQLAKQVVALYRGEHLRESAGQVVTKLIADGSLKERQTKAERIEAAAVSYLRTRGNRATSGELLQAMQEAGIDIGGAAPNKALSAYLSNAKQLNNVREYGGYGLVEWGDGRGPDLLTKTGA